MNSQPTSNQREERLKQIRERRNALQLRHGDWPCQTVHNSKERAFQQYVLADIDFLLSLIDSQAAEAPDVQPVVEELSKCAVFGTWWSGLHGTYRTELRARLGATLDSAATSMRDQCVEKVKTMRDGWLARLPNSDDPTFKSHYQTRANAATEIIADIQSLTLDQVEQKPCPDCAEAARLAYSDATTPGFFNPKCARHQEKQQP